MPSGPYSAPAAVTSSPSIQLRHTLVLALAYATSFAALGLTGPFLALLLDARGLRPETITTLLAVLPLIRVVANPVWAFLADLWQSAATVFRVTALGALAVWALFAYGQSTWLLVLSLGVFTALRSPWASLLDVLSLEHVRQHGGDYGRLRMWGTLAFLCANLGLGHAAKQADIRIAQPLALGCLLLTLAAGMALPGKVAPRSARLTDGLRVLLSKPVLRWYCVVTLLHLPGLAAYDAFYAAELSRSHGTLLAGLAIACGTSLEALLFSRSRRILDTLGLQRALLLSFLASTLRWGLLGFLQNPVAIVLLQSLHALTFGLYYAASVALIDRESPPEVRASAQGLYASFAWGIGVSLCLFATGKLQLHYGLRGVFLFSALSSLLSVFVLLWKPLDTKR